MDELDYSIAALSLLKSAGSSEVTGEIGTQLAEVIASYRALEAAVEVPAELKEKSADLITRAGAAISKDVRALVDEAVATYASSSQDLPEFLYLEGFPGTVPHAKAARGADFPVRGKDYLTNKKKDRTGGNSLFKVRSVQVVNPGEFVYHVAQQPWCAVPKYAHNNEWLVLNYMIPGATPAQVVVCCSASKALIDQIRAGPVGTGWTSFLPAFWNSPDEASLKEKWDNHFKLFPGMTDASWMIRKAVGEKPALIGRKLEQKYFRGHGYMEVDIDLASSSVATGILRMVRGVSKSMIVDLGIALEADTEESLPEVMLAQTHFNKVDLDGGESV